jgi:hypothetical protein
VESSHLLMPSQFRPKSETGFGSKVNLGRSTRKTPLARSNVKGVRDKAARSSPSSSSSLV